MFVALLVFVGVDEVNVARLSKSKVEVLLEVLLDEGGGILNGFVGAT